MCWDRHCCAALWSTTGRQLWLLESTAACLSRLLHPSTMAVKVSVPKLSLLSVWGQPVFMAQPSTPLCQSLQCSWLTFNSEARIKRAKEHQMRLEAGVHSKPDHSLSCTSTSISCATLSPWGLQAPSVWEVCSVKAQRALECIGQCCDVVAQRTITLL